jgi:hypothetical protein
MVLETKKMYFYNYLKSDQKLNCQADFGHNPNYEPMVKVCEYSFGYFLGGIIVSLIRAIRRFLRFLAFLHSQV